MTGFCATLTIWAPSAYSSVPEHWLPTYAGLGHVPGSLSAGEQTTEEVLIAIWDNPEDGLE